MVTKTSSLSAISLAMIWLFGWPASHSSPWGFSGAQAPLPFSSFYPEQVHRKSAHSGWWCHSPAWHPLAQELHRWPLGALQLSVLGAAAWHDPPDSRSLQGTYLNGCWQWSAQSPHHCQWTFKWIPDCQRWCPPEWNRILVGGTSDLSSSERPKTVTFIYFWALPS